MAISSVNFQKAKSNSVAETTREFEAKYLLPKEHRGENEFYNCGIDEKELFNQELAKAERKGGRVPKVENSLWEGVINLNKKHTIEDVNRVGEHIAKKFNIHYTRGALHRDEGHINKKGKVEYNLHAHVNFMTYKDGKQNWRLEFIDKEALRELQTEVAEILGMERGELNSKAVRANHRIFREKADEIKAEREALKENQALKEQIKDLKNENKNLKTQNTKLKNANETLKFDKKELEEQLKKLNAELREKIKENEGVRGDYAQLEQLNKNLKEDLKNKVLDHETLLKSFQELEDKLIKKDSEIEDLKSENIDLKSEIEALKYQLDLKEKRSQSYFGLNKELKEEIVSLKEQINDLESKNDTLTDKVIDLEEKIDLKANMDDLSSPKQIKKEDYLKDIVNQYDSTRTGREESESSQTKKTNLERMQELQKQKKSSLLDKFKEVDKVQEQEAPEVKKKSFRER